MERRDDSDIEVGTWLDEASSRNVEEDGKEHLLFMTLQIFYSPHG
jgi:hypothetical protein